jgi:hypothetical protein
MYHRIPLIARYSRCAIQILCLVVVLPVMSSVEDESGHSGDNVLLDVGLLVFDPGIPADESTHSKLGIFPHIRKAESRFMPVILRGVLMVSQEWGAVRVLPDALESSELMVTGTILHSDGQRLELQIKARDATGEYWLDRVYTGTLDISGYTGEGATDPFLGVYQHIASDLLAVRRQKSSKALAGIREVALMRYASELAPEAFASFLALSPEQTYELVRLPAQDDPMIARVIGLRNKEYLFIDTVDEQYQRLNDEMSPTYSLWRQHNAEQAQYREEYRDRVSSRDRAGRKGSFAALEQTYNAYKWSKIHEQDLDELALGFNNEVAPTVMEVSGTVFRLSGALDTQYAEWRDILQRIFRLEMGLPPAL